MSDVLLGAVAVLLGAGLALGSGAIAQTQLDGDRERREQHPSYEAMWDAAQRALPRWLRGDRLALGYARGSMLVVGLTLFAIGAALIVRAV